MGCQLLHCQLLCGLQLGRPAACICGQAGGLHKGKGHRLGRHTPLRVGCYHLSPRWAHTHCPKRLKTDSLRLSMARLCVTNGVAPYKRWQLWLCTSCMAGPVSSAWQSAESCLWSLAMQQCRSVIQGGHREHQNFQQQWRRAVLRMSAEIVANRGRIEALLEASI